MSTRPSQLSSVLSVFSVFNPLDARGALAFRPEATQLHIGSHPSGAQYQKGVSAPRGEPR